MKRLASAFVPTAMLAVGRRCDAAFSPSGAGDLVGRAIFRGSGANGPAVRTGGTRLFVDVDVPKFAVATSEDDGGPTPAPPAPIVDDGPPKFAVGVVDDLPIDDLPKFALEDAEEDAEEDANDAAAATPEDLSVDSNLPTFAVGPVDDPPKDGPPKFVLEDAEEDAKEDATVVAAATSEDPPDGSEPPEDGGAEMTPAPPPPPQFDPTDPEALIAATKSFVSTDLGVRTSRLSDYSALGDSFVWVSGNNLADGRTGPLTKEEYLAAGRYFDLRGSFPDMEHNAHDFRVIVDEAEGGTGGDDGEEEGTEKAPEEITVRFTTRTTGTFRGAPLKLRTKVLEPNGREMRCPPTSVSVTYSTEGEDRGKITKLVTDMVLDRDAGNTEGLSGVAAAAIAGGASRSELFEVGGGPPPLVALGRLFGRPSKGGGGDGPTTTTTTTTPPFPSEIMIRLAEGVASSDFGLDDPGLLAEDFAYAEPLAGPLGKAEYLERFGAYDVRGGVPDLDYGLRNFRIDPYDPYRVWADSRATGTRTGYIGTRPLPPGVDSAPYEAPPEAIGFTFDDDGFCTRLTAAAPMDPLLGNTGGLGGVYGLLYATGTPANALRTRSLNAFLGRASRSLLSRATGGGPGADGWKLTDGRVVGGLPPAATTTPGGFLASLSSSLSSGMAVAVPPKSLPPAAGPPAKKEPFFASEQTKLQAPRIALPTKAESGAATESPIAPAKTIQTEQAESRTTEKKAPIGSSPANSVTSKAQQLRDAAKAARAEAAEAKRKAAAKKAEESAAKRALADSRIEAQRKAEELRAEQLAAKEEAAAAAREDAENRRSKAEESRAERRAAEEKASAAGRKDADEKRRKAEELREERRAAKEKAAAAAREDAAAKKQEAERLREERRAAKEKAAAAAREDAAAKKQEAERLRAEQRAAKEKAAAVGRENAAAEKRRKERAAATKPRATPPAAPDGGDAASAGRRGGGMFSFLSGGSAAGTPPTTTSVAGKSPSPKPAPTPPAERSPTISLFGSSRPASSSAAGTAKRQPKEAKAPRAVAKGASSSSAVARSPTISLFGAKSPGPKAKAKAAPKKTPGRPGKKSPAMNVVGIGGGGGAKRSPTINLLKKQPSKKKTGLAKAPDKSKEAEAPSKRNKSPTFNLFGGGFGASAPSKKQVTSQETASIGRSPAVDLSKKRPPKTKSGVAKSFDKSKESKAPGERSRSPTFNLFGRGGAGAPTPAKKKKTSGGRDPAVDLPKARSPKKRSGVAGPSDESKEARAPAKGRRGPTFGLFGGGTTAPAEKRKTSAPPSLPKDRPPKKKSGVAESSAKSKGKKAPKKGKKGLPFDLFGGGPAAPARKRPEKVAVPKGVPVLKRWKPAREDAVEGRIFGSASFEDGTRVTTSSIVKGRERGKFVAGSVVRTKSGSRYFLD